MSVYKVMITQIVGNKNIGSAVLTTDFTELEDALSAGNEYRLNELCPVEIREYDESKNNIISFDAQDTGVVVHRDVSGIVKAIQEEYHQSDIVFSELIRHMLEDVDADFHALVLCLTDEEINGLLEWSGDNEWAKCVDGQIFLR